MDRGASAAVVTELGKETTAPCWLVSIAFDTPVYLTSAWADVVHGGNTYLANGHFLGLDGIEETARLEVPTVTVTVSSVDGAWMAVGVGQAYMDRQVIVYKAFIDYNSRAISSPFVVFDGRVDSLLIKDDNNGLCSVAVTATSHFGDFDRTNGRRTNDESQQKYFSGDRFFDLVSQSNRSLNWGVVK